MTLHLYRPSTLTLPQRRIAERAAFLPPAPCNAYKSSTAIISASPS
jgi:hypothetical protein